MNAFKFVTNWFRQIRVAFEIDKLTRSEEIPRRIELCEETLSWLEPKDNPFLWAYLQNDIGRSLLENPLGDRSENIERAIQAFENTLTVCTRENFPQQWAQVQNNLEFAHNQRIQENYFDFIKELLQVIYDNNGDSEIMYSFFCNHLEKLDETLGEILYQKTTKLFYNSVSEKAETLASLIVIFGIRIQEFPLGNRKNNLEISIKAYQSALVFYTHEAFPVKWASTQYFLGLALRDRIRGEKAGEHLTYAMSINTYSSQKLENLQLDHKEK